MRLFAPGEMGKLCDTYTLGVHAQGTAARKWLGLETASKFASVAAGSNGSPLQHVQQLQNVPAKK